MSSPGFNYVGRLPCGCVIMIHTDNADRGTARMVAEVIEDGGYVERVSDEEYRDKIRHEPGFMHCIHQTVQAELGI